MPRVIHFEIHADDPERAAKFYSDVFDWEIKKWEGPQNYWLVMTGPKDLPGINGGIVERQGKQPDDAIAAYVCTIDVPSIDEFLNKIKTSGGVLATPKMEVPKVGWLAYCKDTEGNMFGIMQMDPDAEMQQM